MISDDNSSFTATGVEMQVTEKLCSKKKKAPKLLNLGASFLLTLRKFVLLEAVPELA
jgi:hypothetical protein